MIADSLVNFKSRSGKRAISSNGENIYRLNTKTTTTVLRDINSGL